MDHKPEIGDQVKLSAFLGDTIPPKNCDPSENFWRLIGQRGKVIAEIPGSDRVLVGFECSIQSFGLQCHNPEPNSLRIKWADLERA
ncbi:hypothetical protein [Geothrix sp. PMB-07]|uniref:hypothetical protein n=1 Tax=Geothrix sp. PMB-07 TaxID=3068640 RepID=UPI002741690A|nr:hypothetical protein [Geothrix sp. PMB-07]WLT30420.1 hypothetical protein Q9293_11890 [Geothrix sp. PMB-07]